jgi:hypothetical protein
MPLRAGSVLVAQVIQAVAFIAYAWVRGPISVLVVATTVLMRPLEKCIPAVGNGGRADPLTWPYAGRVVLHGPAPVVADPLGRRSITLCHR